MQASCIAVQTKPSTSGTPRIAVALCSGEGRSMPMMSCPGNCEGAKIPEHQLSDLHQDRSGDKT